MHNDPLPPSGATDANARRRDLSIALAVCLPALLVGFLADSRWWLIYYGNYAAVSIARRHDLYWRVRAVRLWI